MSAYWTQSVSPRDRLQQLTAGPRHARLSADVSALLDDETRRLLDDSHLLIATQRLILLNVIGQGQGWKKLGFLNQKWVFRFSKVFFYVLTYKCQSHYDPQAQ